MNYLANSQFKTPPTNGLGARTLTIQLWNGQLRDVAGGDEGLDVEGERGLEAEDAVGGVLEFELFFLGEVGGVVGGEAVDRAVDDAADAGICVALSPQGRVHLVVRVERAAGFVGE